MQHLIYGIQSRSVCDAANLVFAVVFHFVMGFVLEIKNNKARPVNMQ
jgi:hypothetical protein